MRYDRRPCLYKDGTMATGTVKIDGSTEVFNSSGAWQYTWDGN